jgi:transposase
MEKKTMRKKHRKYDANFKSEVLKMIKTQPVAEVAQKMGIGENLLYKWRAEEKTEQTPPQRETNEELEQLRRQVKQLETERDILKKALVIFGRGT